MKSCKQITSSEKKKRKHPNRISKKSTLKKKINLATVLNRSRSAVALNLNSISLIQLRKMIGFSCLALFMLNLIALNSTVITITIDNYNNRNQKKLTPNNVMTQISKRNKDWHRTMDIRKRNVADRSPRLARWTSTHNGTDRSPRRNSVSFWKTQIY